MTLLTITTLLALANSSVSSTFLRSPYLLWDHPLRSRIIELSIWSPTTTSLCSEYLICGVLAKCWRPGIGILIGTPRATSQSRSFLYYWLLVSSSGRSDLIPRLIFHAVPTCILPLRIVEALCTRFILAKNYLCELDVDTAWRITRGSQIKSATPEHFQVAKLCKVEHNVFASFPKSLSSPWRISSGAQWSVAYEIHWLIRALHLVDLVFDEPLRISPASLMTKALDTKSFGLGSRPYSNTVDMNWWWYLTGAKLLYRVSILFSHINLRISSG